MKTLKIFAMACVALFMASCGSGENTKDLKVETKIAGDAATAEQWNSIVEVVDTAAVYSMEKISKDDSGKAFDEQKWTVKVRVNVTSDAVKGVPAAELQHQLPELTLDVLNGEGKEILGQKGYKLEGDNLKAFADLLSKGKGAQGVVVFTLSTNNSDDCDKWFNEEAASVRIVTASAEGGSSRISSSSMGSGSGSGSYDMSADMNPDDLNMGDLNAADMEMGDMASADMLPSASADEACADAI